MFGRWRLGSAGRRAPAAVPTGRVAYAIGDIHGRRDLLAELLQSLAQDAERSRAEGASPIIVFIGDYVDRGFESRGVIDLVLKLQNEEQVETVCLKGNHEAMLLAFLEDPWEAQGWLQYGGLETLASYGVKVPPGPADPGALGAVRDAFAAALPPEHLRFLNALKLFHELGDYVFAHAGVRAGRGLEDQVEDDLLWIREPFLKPSFRYEKVVVHGHSPEGAVHLGEHRIGVDTGAYATGVLSAVRLEGEQRGVIATKGAGGRL